LQENWRTDERTRTGDLSSLGVRKRGFPGIAAAGYGLQNPHA
jgi:hypothetical protein